MMYDAIGLGFRKVVMSCGGQLHTTVSHDGPTETLKRIIMELEKTRSKKNSKKRDDIFVQVPESISFVDTATMPHDSHCFWNCTLCKATHDGMSMLTREEWEEFREVRSRTPFESKLACSNAHIRTEESVRMVRLPVLFITTSLCVRKQSIDNEFYPGNAFSVNLMLKLHDGSPSSFSRMVAWVVENSLPRALGIISCICFDFNVAASCYLSAASQIDLMCLQLPLTLTVKNIINVAIASYPGRRLEGDWTTDVLTDAATRVEESVKRNSYSQPSIT
ncbi:hypothetical protein POTOM_001867 [Populus tomentosa]|uniref:Uncharacterized protein n=1 Tax=Populus tomentosa TaxID=118781 RepID=A0A8X8DIR0_POPTO|nr:hypothetical protein POTOM_001867 [Populus tomentosa]